MFNEIVEIIFSFNLYRNVFFVYFIVFDGLIIYWIFMVIIVYSKLIIGVVIIN